MSDDIDILQQVNEIDLSTVETSFPLLASGAVKATVVSAKWDKADSKKKAGQTNTFALIEYALAQPWKTSGHDGPVKTINPGDRGSKIIERVYVGKFIDEKDDNKEKWYGVDRLTKLREAIFGKAPEGTKLVLDELIGQEVTLRLLFEAAPVNKDTKEVMGPRTQVQDYVRKAK